jgi:hypothetical protein
VNNRYQIAMLNDESPMRVTSYNEKCLRVLVKGRKLYVPILPLSSGDRVAHVGWRRRTDAEDVYDATATLAKTRFLRANNLV